MYWTGYYIKNLLIIKSLPVFENNGVKYNLILTTSITFNADNLYNKLLNLNTYDIEQLTENTLQNNYIGENKTKRKNVTIQYSLPDSSPDCNMTITTNDSKQNTVTYRNALIEDANFHRVKTIKIFHDIKQLLINEFEYYPSGH